ncbi:MAG TPA: ribosomal protein S18-alanine N-acetyltransferase [Sphingomonadaceae bacterium]|jgi:ribosomal-protein-alanine N-acetyltransferase|nr:ribosomal protein S18-alanine N-acetyltransferase [Sphingomonadaceae bacterium]
MAKDERFTLRVGDSKDIAAVADVIDEAFDAAYGEAWTAAQCLGILGLPGVWLTLAEVDGAVAGFALARVIVDEAELLLIGVKPGQRRAGIGGALLDHCADMARERRAKRLYLEVRNGNKAAILYERAGFSQIGRRPAYYRGKDGAVYDALSLVISLDTSMMAQSSPK